GNSSTDTSTLEENSNILNTHIILKQQPSDESSNDYVTISDNTVELRETEEIPSLLDDETSITESENDICAGRTVDQEQASDVFTL
ncbi:hypothetical protein CU098_004131, partial [Rhizopus stolonifer]